MSSPFSDKDLMDGVPNSYSDKKVIPEKVAKKIEILDAIAPNSDDDDEEDTSVDQSTSRKKRRKDEVLAKEEVESIEREIKEAEKHRSPWEATISPRSLRSKVISYQAKALAGKVKPLVCPAHCDTLTFPMIEPHNGGEKVVLRCSVVTCLHKFDVTKDVKLINHICDNSE